MEQIGFASDLMPHVAPLPKPPKVPYKRPSRAKVRVLPPSFPIKVIAPEEHRKQVMRQPRACLSGISESCQRTFLSEHPGHRVCDECKAHSAWTSPAEFSVVSASF